MFTAAFLIVAKIWKQPESPSRDKWIKKMWCIYYSAIKKNKILPFATTWMDLEDIILSGITQRKKKTLCYCLHIESKNKTNEQI